MAVVVMMDDAMRQMFPGNGTVYLRNVYWEDALWHIPAQTHTS